MIDSIKYKKGQGNLETLILIGGGVLVAVVIVTILVSLGGESRNSASEQVDNVSSSTDGPLPPTITSVKANYLDCEYIDPPGIREGLLTFSWKPLSKEGTFRLIIEDSSNNIVGDLDYVVTENTEMQDMNNLNPNNTVGLIVSGINLDKLSCGDTYYLSIEVSKNNQSKTSSRYSFNWADSGPKTSIISRPVFDPIPGSYNFSEFPLSVSLYSNDSSSSIYYTLDGTDPDSSSLLYNFPFTINSGTIIKAISFNGSIYSNIATGTYTVSYDTVSSVTANPDSSSNIENPFFVVLSSLTPASTIYYTLDFSTPDCSGSYLEYISPINVSADATIKAIACKENYNDSSVSTFTYSFFVPLDPVTFNPPAGNYNTVQNISLSNSNPGADIHYTTSGFDPTLLSPIYSGPISVSSQVTIKAMAAVGLNTSPVSQADYNVVLPANVASFSSPSGTYNDNLFVDLSTTTPLPYNIYYTTDGSTPTSSSTQYQGISIPVTRNQTLKAIVYKSGYLPSSVTQADYTFKLNAPTFNPLPGAYSDSQVITINSVAGSQVRYTLDNSTPTQTTGTLINSGESTSSITSTSTLKAITYKTGWTSSDVSSGVYTINAPASTPTFNPNGGTHTNSVTVSLNCTTPSSTIRYTTDGSDPSRTEGTIYSSALNFTSTTTVKAVCYASGYSTSSIATQTFTVQLIANTASFSSPSGTYNDNLFVDLSTTTPLPYNIYYTTDGSTPTSSSTQYQGVSIPVTRNTTLKAIVYKLGYLPSSVTQADYTFKLNAPTFNPLPGAYSDSQVVTINSVAGSQVRYTLDNSTPTQTTGTLINSGESTSSITSTSTLKAITYKTGWTSSDVSSGVYTINAPAATPTFNPNGGTHTNSVTVNLNCTTPSSTIRYTTDGSDPSRTEGTIYSSALTLTSTTTVKAVCYASGYSTSFIATQTFTVQLMVSNPTFSVNGGTFNNDQQVILNTTTPGAMLRYTLNGIDPTETIGTEISPGTSITLNTNDTQIKAIAYRSGYQSSEVITSNIFNFISSTPSSTLSAGTYTSAQNVPLSTTTSDAQIRYTINGSSPTLTTGSVYDGTPIPLSFNGTYTIRAKSFKSGYQESLLFEKTYVINLPEFLVSISNPLDGVIINYNTNINFNSLIENSIGSYSCIWTSSLSGVLSTSCNFSSNSLIEGNHTINLEVTDSIETKSDSISIEIIKPYMLYGWGSNSSGIIGLGDNYSNRLTPKKVGSFTDWNMVSLSYNYSLGIRNGILYSTGRGSYGELGLGNIQLVTTFTQVGSFTDWDYVYTGGRHSLGIRNGILYAWGWNDVGQLGIGNTKDKKVPTQVGSFTDWDSVSGGGFYSLGIRNGVLYAWGENNYGQLGLGDRTDRKSPTQVGSFTDWDFVSAGPYQSYAIRNGKLYAWGWNLEGQLGLDDTNERILVPTQVGSFTDWDYVSGNFHSLGLRNGKLYAWGQNDYGQLGLGDTTDRTVPTQVGSFSDWDYVSAGNTHSLGLRNGKLYAWGRNNAGQLGLGDTTNRTVPTQVGSFSDWYYISPNSVSSLAIRNG